MSWFCAYGLCTGQFVVLREVFGLVIARVILLSRRAGDNNVQVLLQPYEVVGRHHARCLSLESRLLGIVRITAENSFVKHSFSEITKVAQVFPVPPDDYDDAADDILVRDVAYERLQL